MSKILPNKSLEWISALSSEDAKEYKNRFVCYELKDGILKLTFFLNPLQSFTKHQGVATRKFNDMNKKMNFATTKATLKDIDRSKKHLAIYVYEVDTVQDDIVASSNNFSDDKKGKVMSKDILDMNKGIEVGCPMHGGFMVTPNNHLGYNSELVAYGCPVCKDEKKIIIDKDNIALHYESMSDEDLIKNKTLISDIFDSRKNIIPPFFKDIDLKGRGLWYGVEGFNNSKQEMTELSITYGNYTLKQVIFGIIDTLKPIKEYIEEIKASSEYKGYIKSMSKKFNLCKTEKDSYFIEHLEGDLYCYSRTDSCKDIAGCIKIFEDCGDFGAVINNWCNRTLYNSAPYKTFLSFDTIKELKSSSEYKEYIAKDIVFNYLKEYYPNIKKENIIYSDIPKNHLLAEKIELKKISFRCYDYKGNIFNVEIGWISEKI